MSSGYFLTIQKSIMEEQLLKVEIKRKEICPSYEFMLDYENYLETKNITSKQKTVVFYNGIKLAFTARQFEILKFISMGYSNNKIAKRLNMKSAAMRLSVYRLMKYFEHKLCGNVDRFYLVIIAQELEGENHLHSTENNS